MQGYNPSASLLPAGGGAIHAMSGGGMGGMPPTPAYNPSASLLPSVGGEVAAYRGGFFADDMGFIGGNTPTPAGAPTGAAPAPPAPAPPAPVPPAPPAPAPAPPTANAAAQPATQSAPPAAPPAANAATNPATKSIMLFGKTIQLEDPNNIKGGILTEAQKETLEVFGLDGPGLSDTEKKKILISLYEGQCNTDKSLIFQVDCEPMRQIVQSLALTLLGKIKEHEAKDDAVNKNVGNPKVTAEKVGDKNFRVSIEFTPAQMSLLSKYKVEEFVQLKRTNQPNMPAAPKKANAAPKKAAAAAAPTTTSNTAASPQSAGDYTQLTTTGIDRPAFECYVISTIQMLYSIPEIRAAILNYNCTLMGLSDEEMAKETDTRIKDMLAQKQTEESEKQTDKTKSINIYSLISSQNIFCTLKTIFQDLNKNTNTFTNILNKKKGDQVRTATIADIKYIAYLIKWFIGYKNHIIEKSTSEAKKVFEKPGDQQDQDDFLNFIIGISQYEETLKFMNDLFGFRRGTQWDCENKAPKPAVEDKDINTMFTLNLIGYRNNNDPSRGDAANKYEKTDTISGETINYISVDKALQFELRPESIPAVDGCGPEGIGQGVGAKQLTITPTDENKYILLKPWAFPAAAPQGAATKATNIRLFVNSEIEISKIRYHIFGAVLYNGTGRMGHYTYDRFFIKDESSVDIKSDATSLPFVLYNDNSITYQGSAGSMTVDKDAYMLIYRRVGDSATASEAQAEQAPPAPSNAAKVDSQLTGGEKANKSITSNRVQQIADATGLTVKEVREILKDKKILEHGGAAAAAAEAGSERAEGESGAAAGPPEQEKQTLEAFIKAELGKKTINNIGEEEKKRIISAAIKAGFTETNVEDYFANKAAPAAASEAAPEAPAAAPASPGETGEAPGEAAAPSASTSGSAASGAAPAAPAAAEPAASNFASNRGEGTAARPPAAAAEGPTEGAASGVNKQGGVPSPEPAAGKGTAPASPAANNTQRGQGAPAPKINKATLNELTRARQQAFNKTALEKALKKAPKNRTANNIARIDKNEKNRAAERLVQEKSAEIEKVKNEIFKLYEEEQKLVKTISTSKETIQTLNAEAIQLKLAGKKNDAVRKVTQRIQEQKVLGTASATRNYIHRNRLALQRKYSDIITPEQEEDLKREVEGMAASGSSSGPAKGGGKHRKTATKSKAKTKTFKKRPSKKRSNKTFKRRK